MSKFLPETSSLLELTLLKRSIGSARELIELKSEINKHGRSPYRTMIEALQNSAIRVLGLGETHHGCPLRKAGKNIMPKLAQAGATHLAVELPEVVQPIFDLLDEDDGKNRFKAGLKLLRGVAFIDEHWITMVKAAHRAGLKVVAVDANDHRDRQQRERALAGNVNKILQSAPQSKVVFWVGSVHLGNRPGLSGIMPAGQLLRELGRKNQLHPYQTFYICNFQMDGPESVIFSVNNITADLDAPVVISTQSVPAFGKLTFSTVELAPGDRCETLDFYDHILAYPPDDVSRLVARQLAFLKSLQSQ